MRYYHTYHRLPLKVAVTAGFVGWLACVLVAIPSKEFLDKIPDQLAKIMPAKFWSRSYPRYGKISASWQDLGLLPRSCSSWQESCPRTLVLVATVVAIVMVLWYQYSPIQDYWYYALPLICCSYVWVQRSAFRAAWQGMATNLVLLLKGTVHLVGVVVGWRPLS